MRMFLFTNAGTLLVVPNVLVFHFGPLHFRRALPRHSARPDHGDREEGSIKSGTVTYDDGWRTRRGRSKQQAVVTAGWLAGVYVDSSIGHSSTTLFRLQQHTHRPGPHRANAVDSLNGLNRSLLASVPSVLYHSHTHTHASPWSMVAKYNTSSLFSARLNLPAAAWRGFGLGSWIGWLGFIPRACSG